MPATGKAGRYETSDLHLTCFLRRSGYGLAGRRLDGRRWTRIHRDRPERPARMMVRDG